MRVLIFQSPPNVALSDVSTYETEMRRLRLEDFGFIVMTKE